MISFLSNKMEEIFQPKRHGYFDFLQSPLFRLAKG